MAAARPDRGLSSEGLYRSLVANFEAAHTNFKEASEEFNAVLTGSMAGLSEGQRRTHIDGANRRFEATRTQLMIAVERLNWFMIHVVVSPRSLIPENPPAA